MQIPMNKLPYKIMLDRYSEKDITKKTLNTGSIVVATVDETNPLYPQKEVCYVTEVVDLHHIKLTNAFEDKNYIVDVDKIQVPLELKPQQIWNRIALGNAQNEKDTVKWNKKFRALLKDWRFVPGGRIMAMCGAKCQQSLTAFNCFVIPSPEDSRGGAIKTLNNMVEIMSRGGGVGLSLCTLRPRNAVVRGVNGISSGSVSWGAGYSFYTGLIEQGGSRRGALLEGQAVWHPDIEEFIDAKRKAGTITNANLSVLVTDAFMDAVFNNTDWNLEFPDTAFEKYDSEWDGNLTKWKSKGYPVIIYKTVKAKDLWNKIIEAAWASGEPGIIWIERYNKLSNSWYFEEIVCTNPCLTGDTVILTDKGYVEIQNVVGQEVNVWNGFEFSKVIPEITGRHQKIMKVKFTDGSELKCTLYHKFVTTKGRIQAKDLKVGDKLQKWTYPIIEGNVSLSERIAYTKGFVSGDGTANSQDLFLYSEKQALVPFLHCSSVSDKLGSPELYGDRVCARIPKTYAVNKGWVPDVTYSIKTRLDWLAGLIDANGTLNDAGGSIAIWSSNRKFLQNVRYMLNTLGAASSLNIGTNGGEKLLPNGKGGYQYYDTQDCYRVVISAWNVKHLMNLGLNTHRVPLIANPNRDASRYIQISSLELLPGIEDKVYCFNEPIRHTGCFNGVVTAQCGEQGLAPWGVCNLGHVNLAKCPIVDGQIDRAWLEETVRLAVRFLDNIIDITPYFFEENRKVQQNERRIGLGTMGLAELLIKLHIRYGSQRCLEVVDKLYNFIKVVAYDESVELAKEKGPFPLFDKDKYIQGKFIQTLPKALIDKIYNYGIRNVAILTQAPTGSTGTMCETSTGIEPFYAFNYTRSGRLGIEEQHVGIAQEWLDAHPTAPKLPPEFVTAMELSPEAHIRVMATIQKHTDSSISKTCNVPHDYTVEQVRDLYELGYKLGCKGMTVYRDGSRDSQVLNLNKETEKTPAPTEVIVHDVPKDTIYKLVNINTGCGKIKMMVGCYNHKVTDIYTIPISEGGCVLSIQGLAITISKYLRTGAPIQELYQSSLKAGNCPSFQFRRGAGAKNLCGKSCFNAILKTIVDFEEAMTPENTKAKDADPFKAKDTRQVLDSNISQIATAAKAFTVPGKRNICPSCGSEMISETGCWQCKNCGYSKCE